MTRSSPGVRRVAAILNFMADHPGQAFVLTDLVRALKLSRATCHALLTGLVEVGYLYRTSDKSYVLGPALAAIGRTAASSISPLQVAQSELRRLADDHDLIASAYVLDGDSLVVRERAASASHVGYLGPVGTRLRLRPQTAAVFLAWSPPEAVQAWLGSQAAPRAPAPPEELLQGMAFAREHGFVAIVRASPSGTRNAEALLGSETAQISVALAPAIDPAGTYSLAALIAPVFDDRDRVVFAIGLAGFQPEAGGAQVLETAADLRSACERISRFNAGKQPLDLSKDALAA